MPNLANVLKDEIRRLARKELKQQVSALKSASAQHRRDIAALKRENHDLARKIARLEQQRPKREVARVSDDDEPQVRFSPQWVSRHREKLGLSQADYGALVGVSGVTIYNWESGKVRPRAQQLASWGAIKKLGKREAARRLEELA
jgi:DNA-binding transcriptional regulator YiaG